MRAKLLFLLLGVVACNGLVPARTLVDAFNDGMLESHPDPFYRPEQRAEDVVARRMREELGDAYFGQQGTNARVSVWFRGLADHTSAFMNQTLPMEAALAQEVAQCQTQSQAQKRVQQALDLRDEGAIAFKPICKKRHEPDPEAIAVLADWVRFRTAVERAVSVADGLLDERLATMDEVVRGAERAFRDTADYLESRRWRREIGRPVTGLVVKGGAANGLYSAGVVWVALQIIHNCVTEKLCDRSKVGFTLVSGTSAGATVVGAVDKFQTALDKSDGDTGAVLQQYEHWYLCSSMNDLYCVRNNSAVNLARGPGGSPNKVQDALLDFEGLATKIEKDYHCDEMNNRSELVLNAVDFRTGRLYALSDQDRTTLKTPWDVTKAIVSSAALPFIVRPIYNLPTDPIKDGTFAYLDGGIRSELPVLALVRRGVERVLVVSSEPSVMGETGPLHNATDMAIRYLAVSTGGVTEAELEHARTRAAAGRLAEHETCTDFLRRTDPSRAKEDKLCTADYCDRDAVCAGDYAKACDRDGAVHPMGPNEAPHNAEIVEKTWTMTNIWRDDRRVPGLPGYAFEPLEQRRLMLAGAEAARQKCEAIARSVGIETNDKVTLAKLYAWCSSPVPTTVQACGDQGAKATKTAAPDCRPEDPEHPGPQPDPQTKSTNACAVPK